MDMHERDDNAISENMLFAFGGVERNGVTIHCDGLSV